MHEPLSESLIRIVKNSSQTERITLNDLLGRTDGRGLYLVVILLALPFIVPVSIPGVSTVLGLSIALLSFKLAFGAQPRLPNFMGNRHISPQMERRVIKGSVKFLRFVEKLVKPRRTPWMTTRPARFANAVLMTSMGLFLAMPFPPLPPFTNSLPCYSIILLAASMMEEDGVTIWIAYAVCLGTAIYLVVIIGVLQTAAVNCGRRSSAGSIDEIPLTMAPSQPALTLIWRRR
jgi:hypothetical protein